MDTQKHNSLPFEYSWSEDDRYYNVTFSQDFGVIKEGDYFDVVIASESCITCSIDEGATVTVNYKLITVAEAQNEQT